MIKFLLILFLVVKLNKCGKTMTRTLMPAKCIVYAKQIHTFKNNLIYAQM